MDQPAGTSGQIRGHIRDQQASGNGGPAFERWLRWLGGGSLAAFVISMILHSFGGLLSAFILVGGMPGGSGGGDTQRGNGTVEFAVVTEGELAAMQQDAALPSGMPLVPESTADGGEEVDLYDTASGGGGSEGVSELGADSIGGGDISGGGGEGLGLGGSGGGGGASFFGIEAQGSRFAYIVDISGSMNVEGRIQALQRELMKSIEGLLENASFYVVLFSGDAQVLGGRKDWSEATDPNKRWARRAVARITAQGETNPLPAFRMVLTTKPRPDAVYFMTDGDFGAQADLVALEIAALNSQFKIPIHCICFVQRDSEAVMKRIARESGGSYNFVPGPTP